MQLFPQGRPCSCGRRGCWQAHAGGGALRALLHEYRQAGYQLPGLPEELAELAHASHEQAIAIWEEQGVLLGTGIAVLSRRWPHAFGCGLYDGTGQGNLDSIRT